MYPFTEDKIIANYPFEIDEITKNQMFRVNKNDSVCNYKKSDFLVPHRKDYYFFAFITSGSSRHWIDMTRYDVKPSSLYFTIPSQVHLKEEARPMSGFTMSFTSEFLLSDNGLLKDLPLIQNPHNAHELSLTPDESQFVTETFENILHAYHEKDSWQHSMILSHVRILLIYLSRLYLKQHGQDEKNVEKVMLKNFLAKIDESFSEYHEVATYAGMLNVSAGHLSDVVKEQSGKPAIAHIHERLLLEAKRLLIHSDQAIKEIAWSLGFEDASYFNRFFKRLTSYTPVHYRNNIREMYH